MIIDYQEIRKEDRTAEIPVDLWLELWETFEKLATRISNKWNYSAYSYKKEFTDDAVIKCIESIFKFDITKYDNPFAYFTSIIENKFKLFLKKEKAQSDLKHLSYEKYNQITDQMIQDHNNGIDSCLLLETRLRELYNNTGVSAKVNRD